MDKKNVKLVLKKSKEYVKKPNYIMDLFDMSIVWCDNKIAEILGYTPEELLTKNARELIDESYPEKEKNRLLTLSLEKNKGINPLNVKTKSGKRVKLDFRYMLVEHNGSYFEVGSVSRPTE